MLAAGLFFFEIRHISGWLPAGLSFFSWRLLAQTFLILPRNRSRKKPGLPANRNLIFRYRLRLPSTGNPSHRKTFCLGLGGTYCAMSPNATHAERWRKLEAEARTIASSMTDPEPRRIMLFIAEGYKLLAERAELRNTQKY